jgi:hypothetical protein
MLYRSERVQLFGYTPRARRGRDSKRRAIGVCLRLRGQGRWRHFQLWLHWPRADLREGRGMWTVEAKTWLTDGSFKGGPHLKSFVRLKVGLGGRRL